MTEEVKDQATLWEENIRNEVDKLLSTFLPNSNNGILGIKYINPVEGVLEDGTTFLNDSKAEGVKIILEFAFEKVIDIPKE